MQEAMFVRAGEVFEPTHLSLAPWDLKLIHGGPIGGLIAQCVEERYGDGWQAARLTLDLMRPTPAHAVRVETSVLRRAKRICVVEVTLTVAGNVAVHGTVLLVRRLAVHVDTLTQRAVPVPSLDDAVGIGGAIAWPHHLGAVEVRSTRLSGFERDVVWLRIVKPVTADVPLTPFVRAATVADWANPLLNADGTAIDWINPDISLAIARPPAGEWLCLVPLTRVADGGISVNTCILTDASQPVGQATVTAIAAPRRSLLGQLPPG